MPLFSSRATTVPSFAKPSTSSGVTLEGGLTIIHLRSGKAIASAAFDRGRLRQIDVKAEAQRFLTDYPKGSTELNRLFDAWSARFDGIASSAATYFYIYGQMIVTSMLPPLRAG